MLNLNTRVCFDKEVIALLVYEKLNRSGVDVTDSFCDFNRVGMNSGPFFI
jgi:hypothetical protein